MNATQTGDLILAALQSRSGSGGATHDLLTLATGIDEDTLIELSQIHQVAGLVHDVLAAHDLVSASALERLDELRRFGQGRSLVAGHTAARVAPVLNAAVADRWLVMKGPALAARYSPSERRTYADLDILVPRRDFAAAVTSLEAAGFPVLTKNWDGFLDYGVGEVPMGTPGMVIDLHWHPIALRQLRRSFAFDVDAMVERRVDFESAVGPLPTFDPEDTLLHLCLHGGLGGGRKLLWLTDIDAVARRANPDWDLVVRRANDVHGATMAATMFDKTVQLLDAPIPADAIDALDSLPGWRALTLLASRDRSDEKRKAGWYSGVVQRASRDEVPEAARTVLTEIVDEVRMRLGRPGLAETGGEINWTRDAGGATGRAAFLDYVGSDALCRKPPGCASSCGRR